MGEYPRYIPTSLFQGDICSFFLGGGGHWGVTSSNSLEEFVDGTSPLGRYPNSFSVFPRKITVHHMGVSQNRGENPPNGCFIMENPMHKYIKMDDLGVPLFLETPILPQKKTLYNPCAILKGMFIFQASIFRKYVSFQWIIHNFLQTKPAPVPRYHSSATSAIWSLHMHWPNCQYT